MLWKKGNKLAFEAIYKKYVIQLLAIAMDKTRDRDVAEELVQDTFMSFYKSNISADKQVSIMPYLYTILKNKIMDWHRQNLSHQKYINHLQITYTEADDSTWALVATRELEQVLKEEVEKLPQQCQKVFNLRRKEYMSNKEIASLLEISENTVEQHMRKALRLLRQSLTQHDLLTMTIFLNLLWKL